MIKLKSLLLENQTPNIFIPRRLEGRFEKYIQSYIKNGSKGNLDLRDMNLTKLPDILKYIKVVGGSFYCNDNKLTSLQGSPKSVGGSFHCNRNNLTSLEGCAKSVGGSFLCDGNNNLTSLEGCPESVGGNFWCNDNNKIKFTEQEVRAICDVKGRVFV